MKLSKISGILYECYDQIKVLGDTAEDNGNEAQEKYLDQLLVEVNDARAAINNGEIEIDKA
jgi:hypothetical protein